MTTTSTSISGNPTIAYIEPVWLFEPHQTGSLTIKTDLSQQVMATNTKLVSSSEINNHMSSDNSQTSKVTPAQIIAEKPTKANPYKTHQKAKALHQSRGYIFTISATLTAMAIGASLLALMMPSCDEGSLNVKLWAFEYQLTKKGNCSIPIPPK